MTKAKQIDVYLDELKDTSYSDLQRMSIKMCMDNIDRYPDSWKKEIDKNPKYIAIEQLLKENKQHEK